MSIKGLFIESKDLKRIIESEWKLYKAYQDLLHECSEAIDLDWIFDLRRRRMTLISQLMELVGLKNLESLKDADFAHPHFSGTRCGMDIMNYLKDLETKHLIELENFSADFYFQPEWKQLVAQELIPAANQNLEKIGEKLARVS